MQITYYVASTLDGFIAKPDGSVDFLSLINGEPEPYQEFVAGIDALLMGRRTYEQILSFGEWPYGNRRCWVMTHHALPSHDTAISIGGSPGNVYDQIRASGVSHLWLVGGGNLAAQFLHHGLIDSVIVSVLPILLGEGIALFSDLTNTVLLFYVRSIPRASGIVEISYKPRLL